jgi:hypothetical protein
MARVPIEGRRYRSKGSSTVRHDDLGDVAIDGMFDQKCTGTLLNRPIHVVMTIEIGAGECRKEITGAD